MPCCSVFEHQPRGSPQSNPRLISLPAPLSWLGPGSRNVCHRYPSLTQRRPRCADHFPTYGTAHSILRWQTRIEAIFFQPRGCWASTLHKERRHPGLRQNRHYSNPAPARHLQNPLPQRPEPSKEICARTVSWAERSTGHRPQQYKTN